MNSFEKRAKKHGLLEVYLELGFVSLAGGLLYRESLYLGNL